MLSSHHNPTAVEGTQSFLLAKTTDTVELALRHVEGQNIVDWADIELVFPGVKRVRNGNSVIKFHKSFGQESTNCCPHAVVNVVLSTSVEPRGMQSSRLDPADRPTELTDTPADAPGKDKATAVLGITQHSLEMAVSNVGSFDTFLSSASNVSASFKAALFQRIVKQASRTAQDSDIDQRLRQEMNFQELQELKIMMTKNMALMEDMNAKQQEINQLQEQALEHHKIMRQLQEQALDNDKEMKRLQEKALERLAVLQSRVQAILTQTYELHEYPIPRLFIVLPQYPSGWDILKSFTNKYRLYFLCECGEHTKAAGSSSKIPHEIHLAKHEGYETVRPTEFFQQYGPYVLTILKMLKFGVSVASVAVPAVAHLMNGDALDHTAKGLQHLKDCIEPGMNQVISKIEKDSVDEGEPVEHFADQMENNETLEGADLRKLETFLKDKDGNKC